MRFILFGSLKNYSNLSGFPVAFILTYQMEFHHRLWRLPYTEVLVCHKQRVEVFHSNLSLERSWIPFRCWVSLFLTGFTSFGIRARFLFQVCLSFHINRHPKICSQLWCLSFRGHVYLQTHSNGSHLTVNKIYNMQQQK